ncbi:hypothetical protein KGY64_05610, partial [Candidatus Bipolaricaulota bacterium]|nr:hypothetical protein [Candidatus Bipolaricaulota bacterium]
MSGSSESFHYVPVRDTTGHLLTVLLVLLVLLCSSFASAGEIPEDVRLVEEARNLISTYGEGVWPGFGDILPPYAVQTGEVTYLIGGENPPDGFHKDDPEAGLYVK